MSTTRIEFHEIADKPAKVAANLTMTSNTLIQKGNWALLPIRAFWKPLAAVKIRNARLEPMGRVAVRALFRFPDNRRRDTHNLSPVLKVILDGLVAGGLLTDDDDEVIASTTYERWRPNGPRAVAIELTEVTDA